MIYAFSMLALFSGCAPKPLIMQSQYTITLPGDVGTSGKSNFDTFQSSSAGIKTALTFTNPDGDVLEFQVSSLATGTYNMGSGTTMTGTLNVNDPNGNIVPVNIQSTDVGFINLDGVTGSGSSVTGLTGSFKVNVQTTSQDASTLPGTGVIQGTFNFNNSAS